MKLMILVIALLILGALALLVLRWTDRQAEVQLWERLSATEPVASGTFSAGMVANLPNPARRYFLFAIAPGTPLRRVAEIEMDGELSLGTKEAPNYLPMSAHQILAAPDGFIWQVRVGSGSIRIAGSDAAGPEESWSRFWLFGLVPVARAGGTTDHAMSAFGRYVAEAVIWTPAAVLPRDGVTWKAVDENTARITLAHGGMSQSVDLTVDTEGRPVKVVFPRWSDANPEKTFRIQPFGGFLSEFETFEGFRLPTRIEAGNFFDTDAYFPFFLAKVRSIRFPHPATR